MSSGIDADLGRIEITRGINSAFEILRRPGNDWLSDFVLPSTEDPAGDVSMLSNPLPLSSALLASMEGEWMPGISPEKKFVDFVLIPAWNVGPLTIGMSLCHATDSICAETGAPNLQVFSLGRFVYDARTAETLIISKPLSDAGIMAEEGAAGLPHYRTGTVIVHKRHATPKRQEHFFASCDDEMFWNGNIADSILYSESFSSEKAVCAVCGKTNNQFCTCVMLLPTPKSALDFSGFRKNIATHATMSPGRLVLSFRDKLASQFTTTVQHSMGSLLGDMSIGMAMLLRLVAIQNRMKRINPTRLAMPAGADVNLLSDGNEVASMPLEACAATSSSDDDTLASMENTAGVGNPTFQTALNTFASLQLARNNETIHSLSSSVTTTAGTRQDAAVSIESVAMLSRGMSPDSDENGLETNNPNFAPSSEVDEKLRRRLERQRKNRLAAARSNARRKLEREARREDLERLKNSVQVLRAREADLIRENAVLKERAIDMLKQQARDGSTRLQPLHLGLD